MTLPTNNPRSGYVWKYFDGCNCKSCPWKHVVDKGHCRGETYPHWREIPKDWLNNETS